ncbi:Cohesin domain-containing protein, partial [Candidatus Methanophagaceae archaeon]
MCPEAEREIRYMLKDRYDGVMYRKVLKVVSVAVIVLSVLVAFTSSASAADPSADSFGVEDANGYKNTIVSVPVNITNPQDGPICTIKFKLLYNRSIINVTAFHKGALTQDFTTWILGYHPWGIAVTIIDVGDIGIIDGNNGSVILLNFSVLGEPGETSYMNLSGIELSTSTGDPGFDTPPQNGTFTVGGAQAWYLHNDTRMYKGNMSKHAGTLAIPTGGTTNWTANEAA